jgi:hypothetical protein
MTLDEPPPGTLISDPNIGVWKRDRDDGLWRLGGNPDNPAATWTELTTALDGRVPNLSILPPADAGPTVTGPPTELALKISEVDEDGNRRTVDTTTTIIEINPA